METIIEFLNASDINKLFAFIIVIVCACLIGLLFGRAISAVEVLFRGYPPPTPHCDHCDHCDDKS